VGGGIGIGTSNLGSFRLTVEGKIGANEAQVRTAGPAGTDSAFFDNYRLRPLAEVEKYVKQKHHLPKVPSAVEVEKNGINLGEMDALLLKKIEELTRCVIGQNKKIEAMEKELAQAKE
jgi:hypothetical protein